MGNYGYEYGHLVNHYPSRVAIFIDGSNLYHALEENCKRTDLSFSGFVQKLLRGRLLFRTYYYNILQDSRRKPKAYWEQQKFLSALHGVPYLEVRLGRSSYHRGVAIEKGVDIRLATDMLDLGWRNLYTSAILVSGDGDFVYAVQAVKNMGKFLEVACFESNQSRDLVEAADVLIDLNEEFFRGLWVSG